MKIKIISSLLLGLIIHCVPLSAVDALFFEGSLTQVEQQAAREGKLYFVDFYANWCLPCKWMDETTFTDEAVTNYLKSNYVPAKVNIDNFDGFGYKEQYNVHVLPTFIIFNSSGEIVGRYEESLPPSKLLTILKKYDTPENRIKYDVTEPVAQPAEEAPTYTWNEEVYRVPTDESVEEKQEEEAINSTVIEAEEVDSFEEETPVEYPHTIEELSPVVPEVLQEDLGLFNFSVSKKEKFGFAVQVGVFADYGNVLRESVRFQQKYGGETIVHIVNIEGSEVYKLMLGSYEQKTAAQDLVNQIIESGGEALLKDLAQL